MDYNNHYMFQKDGNNNDSQGGEGQQQQKRYRYSQQRSRNLQDNQQTQQQQPSQVQYVPVPIPMQAYNQQMPFVNNVQQSQQQLNPYQSQESLNHYSLQQQQAQHIQQSGYMGMGMNQNNPLQSQLGGYNHTQSTPAFQNQQKIMPNQSSMNAYQPFKAPQYNFSKKFYGNDDDDIYQNKLQKKPDPFKFKSAEQIVNEFKANTLPKLRLKGLIKLQAVMRGYHTRKFVIPKKKMDQRIFVNYIDRLMKHYIEDKMIPDLVLEILTYNKYNEDVSLYSTEYKAHLEIMDKIIMKVVKDISRATVKESTSHLVGRILDDRNKDKPTAEKDPFALVVQDIIMHTIKEDCEQIAKNAVADTTQDYMSEIHLRQLIKDKFINKAVKEVVIDSIEEIIIESMVDDMCEKLTKELAQPLAGRMFEQIQQEVEAVELDRALDSYIYRGMLDITLEQIGVLIDEQNRIKKEKEEQEARNRNFLDDK